MNLIVLAMTTDVISEELTILSDEELVAGILKGKKKLFEILMRRHNARMYRIGMSIVNNDSAIEDLMQNAYVKAYEHLERFEQRASFGTWLTRIMINECMQYVKKSKRTETLETQKEQYMYQNTDRQTPSAITLNRELARALEGALLELPEKYRLVFVMREMEGMSVADTVTALDVSESNVKVRLNRAKEMLRDKLNNYYSSDAIFPFHLERCDRIVRNVFGRLGI
jgi:RNA polymerase sigma factor (sigma-70 family)